MNTVTLTNTSKRDLVLADLVAGSRTRDIALVVAGTIAMSLLAQVSIPLPHSPVPITGQTLGVGLVGATLGRNRGMASMGLYLLAGCFLPVFAGGSSGFSTLYGATAGYLYGFVAAAGLIGWLAERAADRKILFAFLAFALGQLLIFGFGVPVLKLSTGVDWSTAISQGFTPFIFGGIVKAAIGGIALPGTWRAVRRFER